AAPRRADRRPSPSAGSPARPRNTTEKPSSPSPPRQPRPLPSSTHPPPESEDHDRFSSSSICHANFQSIALGWRDQPYTFQSLPALRLRPLDDEGAPPPPVVSVC